MRILEPIDNGKTIRKIHHFCHKHNTYIGEEHSNSIKKHRKTGADEYTNNTSIDTCFHNRPQKTGQHSEGQLPQILSTPWGLNINTGHPNKGLKRDRGR